jgi:hypothetical protein
VAEVKALLLREYLEQLKIECSLAKGLCSAAWPLIETEKVIK